MLYIGGQGRSGTTLLDRVLGQHPAFFSAGELVHLWSRGLTGERCGCGRAFGACPFWTEVGERAFGGWDRLDGPQLMRLQASVERSRFIPALATPVRTPGYAARLQRYTAVLGRLYRAISDASGSRIIIDSSKHPSLAFLLRSVPDVDLRTVLMVRSSHGVAYSWTKQVQKPEVVDRIEHMPRYSPARSAVYWTSYNALLQLLARVGIPSTVVQYERLVRDPRDELARVLALTDQPVDGPGLSFVHTGSVHLAPTHTVSGNPMRFTSGDVPLRVDAEWQRKLRPRDRRLVSALAAPLLHRYGYRLDGTVRDR